MSTARRRLSAGLACGAALLLSRGAHAGDPAAPVVIGTLLSAFGTASLVFTTYDFGMAARGKLPAKGWAIAETVVTTPQTLTYNAGLIIIDTELYKQKKKAERLAPLFILAPVASTMLTTHGIWSLASDRVAPGILLGGSAIIGASAPLTTLALVNAFRGRLSSRYVGVAQILLTVPQVLAGSYQLATSSTDRGPWIGLTAWSSTLLVHGIASTIWGVRRHDDADLPPPPPPPPLLPPPPPPPPPPPNDQQQRPPLLVPESMMLSPTVVTDGVARAPGIAIFGVF